MWMLHCLSKAQGWGVGEGDVYSSRHFLFLFFTGGGHSTARMASSNTVLRPRCVSAEHSRYFTAPGGSRDAVTERSQSGHRAVTEQLCSQLLHNKSQASHWIKVQGLPHTQPTTSHCCHTDLFCHGKALGVGDGRQLLLLQLLNRVLVIPEIEFGAHENDGSVGTVVPHLRVPLQRRNKKWCLLCGAEFPEGPGTFTPQGSQAFPFGQSG